LDLLEVAGLPFCVRARSIMKRRNVEHPGFIPICADSHRGVDEAMPVAGHRLFAQEEPLASGTTRESPATLPMTTSFVG
jgi:hypothetical protein